MKYSVRHLLVITAWIAVIFFILKNLMDNEHCLDFFVGFVQPFRVYFWCFGISDTVFDLELRHRDLPVAPLGFIIGLITFVASVAIIVACLTKVTNYVLKDRSPR